MTIQIWIVIFVYQLGLKPKLRFICEGGIINS